MALQLPAEARPTWYDFGQLVAYCGLSLDRGPCSTVEEQWELVNLASAVFELFKQWGFIDAAEVLNGRTDHETPARDGRKHILRAFIMLVARLYRRRNSPGGIEALGDTGPVYISRRDPDIAMLLGIGEYTRPAVG